MSHTGNWNNRDGRRSEGRGNYNRNNNYKNNRQRQSYGGERNRRELDLDAPPPPRFDPRGHDRKRPHSYGGYGNFNEEFKPKKKASLIEHAEPVLAPPVKMTKELLLRVADFSSFEGDEDLLASVRALAKGLVAVGDLKQYGSDIAEVCAECLSLLPLQAPALATVTALVGRSEPEFSSQVVSKLTGVYLVQFLTTGDILGSKVVLRSLASLASAGCVAVSGTGGFCSLLDQLLTVSYTGWNDGIGLSPAGQTAAYLVAWTLPWALHGLQRDENRGEGRQLLSRAVALFTRVVSEWRSPYSPGGALAVMHVDVISDDQDAESGINKSDSSTLVVVDDEMDSGEASASGATKRLNRGPSGGPCVWDTLWEASRMVLDILIPLLSAPIDATLPFQAPPSMNCLWTDSELEVELGLVTKNISPQKVNITVRITTGTDTDREVDLKEKEEVSVELLRLDEEVYNAVANLAHTVKSNLTSTCQWLRPCMSIFDSDCSVPAASLCRQLTDLEKVLAMDMVRDVIHFLAPVIRPDGTHAGTVDLQCRHLLAISRLFQTAEHMEYVLVEVLLNGLLQLPVSPSRLAGISRVLLQLCKDSPFVPPVLALGVSVLTQFGGEMDSSVWRSIGQWLGFHLINTQLAWPYWQHWAEECAEGEGKGYGPLKLLLRQVLSRCTRAVHAEPVLATVPPTLHPLVPSRTGTYCALLQPLPVSGDHVEGAQAVTPDNNVLQRDKAQELCQMMEQRAEAETVEEWAESLSPTEVQLSGMSEEQLAAWRIQVITQALFEAGSANISNLQSLLDRYRDLLRMYADSPAAQQALLECVLEMYGPANDGSGLTVALDGLMRRAVVGVDEAANRLTQVDTLNALGADPWLGALVETVVDRAGDLVKACAQHYTAVNAMVEKAGDSNDDRMDSGNEEYLISDGRSRDDDEDQVKVDSDLVVANDSTGALKVVSFNENDFDGEHVDPKSAAREALVGGMRQARGVYSTVVGSALALTALSHNVSEGAENLEVAGNRGLVSALQVAGLSLALHALRTLHSVRDFVDDILGEVSCSFTEEEISLVDVIAAEARLDEWLAASVTASLGVVDREGAFHQQALAAWRSFR